MRGRHCATCRSPTWCGSRASSSPASGSPSTATPTSPEELAWLHAYSPYHQVVDGTCYPATLVTTGEEDSRVDPCHARKMAARLQAATSCGDEHPILLRVEPAPATARASPATKQTEERADVLAFLADHLF